MADIDGLKRRIELIDLRLKTAHSARERESAALVETWDQIRDRFRAQNAEILSLRERIRVLEDAKDDLQNMVDSLLGAVEGGLERMSDETVPNIRQMANQLLDESGQPALARTEPPAPVRDAAFPQFGDAGGDDAGREEFDAAASDDSAPAAIGPDGHDAEAEEEPEAEDFLAALERSANAVTGRAVAGDEPEEDDVLALDNPIDAPVSPGIRDLINRIEASSGDLAANDSDDDPEGARDAADSPEELEQDLLEIEQLRSELLGLRKRISGTGI